MSNRPAAAPELTSSADVLTDRPDRYARQLASHLGRKAEATVRRPRVVRRFSGPGARSGA